MAKKLSLKEREEVMKKAMHDKVISNVSTLKNEYKKQVSIALLTAFGLVIALVWKDVITALMPSITKPGFLSKYPILSQIYVAAIITIIGVLGILLISYWEKPKEKKE